MSLLAIDDNYIYSINMMFFYINHFKPQSVKKNVKSLVNNLTNRAWENSVFEINISPMDVINNPRKYAREYRKIMQVNLTYPIIMNKNGIIYDGYHRLAKCVLLDIKMIDAYIFEDDLLKKFIIGEKKDLEDYLDIDIKKIKQLFKKRFLK